MVVMNFVRPLAMGRVGLGWVGAMSHTWALRHSGQYQVVRHDAIRNVLYYVVRAAPDRPDHEDHVDGSNHKPRISISKIGQTENPWL